MIRSGKPSLQPKGWLPLKTVLWVIVAIMVITQPVGFAESTDDPIESAPFSREPGEPTDFPQEIGDGILESGGTEQEELAKAAQNPVASMISLPFQNITNFGVGPDWFIPDFVDTSEKRDTAPGVVTAVFTCSTPSIDKR